MFTPPTSSMRYTLPRADLRALDRRSGAYPTKTRTGDRFRRGNNNFFFDDTRSVVFSTDVNITLPTTFHTGSSHLATDLTSSFVAIGNVKSYAVDQWISHREQVETYQPFIENNLYEQDENAVTNSTFMTGAAYNIAPDRFKSKLSNKTIIRIEIPLTSVSTLSPLSSSISYLNPVTKKFDQIATEISRNPYDESSLPTSAAPILFTPYGMHFLPVRHIPSQASNEIIDAKRIYSKITSYAADGSDGEFYGTGENILFNATSSLLNSRHAANASQSIDLSQYLSHPFLLEKAVIELPFAAGPGWLNDRFGYRSTPTTAILDVGGPLITFALLRQDKDQQSRRDLIASATMTNVLDMTTGSYHIMSSTYTGYSQIMITPEGVGHMINPSVVITGSSLSGSSNFYTGSVKLIMEPLITSHALRLRLSGSGIWHYAPRYNAGDKTARTYDARAISFGSLTKRTGITLETSRNILGGHIASIKTNELDGITNPVRAVDSQYENLAQSVSSLLYRGKVYTDVVSKSSKSPYLLYPKDTLIVAINKHRAVGTPLDNHWLSNSPTNTFRTPLSTVSTHDAKILTGTIRITLYGDLIKEDREFHDTLNQRLETAEIWETIGEEPVLDQFDVTYANELSGSFLDRNNIFTVFPQLVEGIGLAGDGTDPVPILTSSILSYDRDIGHFSVMPARTDVTTTWERLIYGNALEMTDLKFYWLSTKQAWELRKNHKNVNLRSDELFWDTRIPHPEQTCRKSNSNFSTINQSGFPYNHLWSHIYAGDVSTHLPDYTANKGIRDWYMTYPYEPRNIGVSYIFFDSLDKETWNNSLNGNTPLPRVLTYDDLFLEVGVYGSAVLFHGSKFDFAKVFYGIGDGVSATANQYTRPRRGDYPNANYDPTPATDTSWGAEIRGWRYGMMNAFPLHNNAIFRRDHFGHFRDMFEQRVDAKFYDQKTGAKEGPVQVKFYDAKGKITDPLRTLSSNLSYEATSSIPYTDEHARNRSAYDVSNLNITTVTISS